MSSSRPKPRRCDEDAEDRLRLLLHVVLPYARFGLLRNQHVVSPPLALVAAAPQLRVHCEESAPYSLGGTWWLAHTTAHCVVESRGGGLCADVEEVVFSQDGGGPCTRRGCGRDGARGDSPSHSPPLGAPSSSSCCGCWLSEDSFVRASAQAALRQHPKTHPTDAASAEVNGGDDEDDAAVDGADVAAAAPVSAAESIMARHTGTMALVPPQLSSNRRLLSYVRGVPPSFLSFCLQASQQGWQSAARVFLKHYTALDHPSHATPQQQRQQRRLYVVHTQLYAICGYPESRIAHSMWWCLRRLASANTAHALPTAALAHAHQLTYRPTVFAKGKSDSGDVRDAGHASADAASLRRLRALQQRPALLAALERSAAHRHQFARGRGGVPFPSAHGWVTTAANLIVSSDITFWSGTSTVATHELLARHWTPFFAAATRPAEGAAAAAHAHADTHAPPPPPPPPACALFLHGSVVLAVEHKLHRDATNARARRRRAQESSTNDRDMCARAADADDADVGAAAAAATAASVTEEDAEALALDVQPLLFDMADDAPPSPPYGSTVEKGGGAASAGIPRAVNADVPGASTVRTTTTTSSSSTSCGAEIAYDPYEERFLGELVHRQAFELLHCLRVRHLRLPLGPELVATSPRTAPRTVDGATKPEAWDARWLSCLFPCVEVLDVEGPPSVSRSFTAAVRGASYASSTPMAASAASAAAAKSARASAEGRRFRPVGVRPRELALSLGAAAAAQTQTGPLYTMRGLWRLRGLRQLVLRAYPFEVLPRLTPMQGTPHGSTDGAKAMGSGARRRHAELSVMGWPYVTEAGLRTLVQGDGDGRERDGVAAAVAEAAEAGRQLHHREDAHDAALTCPASPRFTMLSLTHMDSATFVEALESLFLPSAASPPPPLLHLPHSLRHLEALAQLTQLELSKTRITTTTLARLDLPHTTPDLRVLRLSSTDVDNVCPLYGLAQLRVLNLASTPITPAGLRLVQWMPALEELFLTQCESLCDVPVDVRRVHNRAAPPPPPPPPRPHLPANDGQDAEDEAADACAVNIFSLGIAPDPAQGGGPARQPFAALRILDLSNMRRLTQRALIAMRQHWGLAERDDVVATRGPVLAAQLTRYAYVNGVCTSSVVAVPDEARATACNASAEAAAWQPVSLTQPPPHRRPPAWMPRLHTLYLMHTSIARLDCLLPLCPRLRVLDISYTPLRDDGLTAQVRCPGTLPRVGEGATATPAYVAVTFPPPLRLERWNCTGTHLTSLLPLSRPPPLDWCYTAPPGAAVARAPAVSASSRGVAGGTSLAAVHVDAAVRPGASMHGVPPAPPPLPLCLHPHPALHADLDTEVQLRTQEAWLRHARHATHDSHAGVPGRSANAAAPAEGYAVRQVDAAHWWASLAGDPSARRRCCGAGSEGAPFELAAQWTPHTAALRSVRVRDGDAAAEPRAAAAAARDTTAASPAQPEAHARAQPPVVRYGVVTLSTVRRLRLGQTEMTATGLAAGFGMPQHHTADAPYPDDAGGAGLTELSLRNTPFLCLPPQAVLQPQHPAAAAGSPTWTDAVALCAVLRLHRETLQVLDLAHTPVSLSTFFHAAAPQPGVEEGRAPVPDITHPATEPQDGAGANPALPTPQAVVPWEEWVTQGAETAVAAVLDALLLHPRLVLDSLVLPYTDSAHASPAAVRGDVRGRRMTERPQRSAPRHVGALGLVRLMQLDVEDSPLSNSLQRLFPRVYHRVRLAALRAAHGGATQPTSELCAGEAELQGVYDPIAAWDPGSSATSDSDASDSEAQQQQQLLRSGLRREQHTRMKLAWATLLHNLFGEQCVVEY